MAGRTDEQIQESLRDALNSDMAQAQINDIAAEVIRFTAAVLCAKYADELIELLKTNFAWSIETARSAKFRKEFMEELLADPTQQMLMRALGWTPADATRRAGYLVDGLADKFEAMVPRLIPAIIDDFQYLAEELELRKADIPSENHVHKYGRLSFQTTHGPKPRH